MLGRVATVIFLSAVAVAASATAYYIVSSFLAPEQVNESQPPPTTTQINESSSTAAVDVASQEYHRFIIMNDQDKMRAATHMAPRELNMIMIGASRVTTGISEPMPGLKNQTIVSLGSGSFVGTNGHKADGIAKLLAVNGAEYLRFEQFKVTNGPDLHVYLTSGGLSNIQKGIDLGLLKGSEGDQNYFLGRPTSTRSDTVIILSQPFRIIFADAALR